VGVDDNQGCEFTLTATKLIKDVLPVPFFVSGTVRNTDAAQLGWLGFSGERDFLFEGNIGFFLLDDLVAAAEYRQKPDRLNKVPGALGHEDDWWTLAGSYIVNEHFNASVAYANLGTVLNHEEPAAPWVQIKYEF
jgi:hypothetical protein